MNPMERARPSFGFPDPALPKTFQAGKKTVSFFGFPFYLVLSVTNGLRTGCIPFVVV